MDSSLALIVPLSSPSYLCEGSKSAAVIRPLGNHLWPRI